MIEGFVFVEDHEHVFHVLAQQLDLLLKRHAVVAGRLAVPPRRMVVVIAIEVAARGASVGDKAGDREQRRARAQHDFS